MTFEMTIHPDHIPYKELVEKGRKISFRKDCVGYLKLRRKVNDQDWQVLVTKARTPY